MSKKDGKSSSLDIFELLQESAKKEKEQRREELLSSLDVKEFFAGGSITIDKRTCKGVECKLCLEVCPTSALYWKAGEVGIVPELCIYCGACVLSCIVDGCIRIQRKRETGEVETFSKPRDFLILQLCINAKKRNERTKDIILKPEDYLREYWWTL